MYANVSDTFWDVVHRYSYIPKEDPLRLEALLRQIPGAESNGRTVLLIGSSLTREGFDIDYLNTRFRDDEVRFYNLGVAGSSQPIDIYMLRRRIIEKAPDTIVYMPFVESFYSEYTDNDYNGLHHHFDISIIPWLVDHFGWRYLLEHQRAITDGVLGKVSILYRFRKQLNRVAERWLKDQLAGADPPEPMQFEYSDSQPPEYFAERLAEYDGAHRYRPTDYTELNQRLFEAFGRDVVSAGIRLVVIDGPVHPLMKALYSDDTAQRYQRYLADTATRVGYTYVRRDGLPDFRPEHFVDFAHLNDVGRSRLSQFMETLMTSGLDPRPSTADLGVGPRQPHRVPARHGGPAAAQ